MPPSVLSAFPSITAFPESFITPATWSPAINATSSSNSSTPEVATVGRPSNHQLFASYMPWLPTRAIPLLWLALGVPSNALCARVWLARELRHSSSIYLAAIALADLAYLLVYMLAFIEVRVGVQLPNFQGGCQLYYWLFHTFQYIPPLLLIVFSAGTSVR